ncbi:MAG TPA: hypothetical protein VM266_07955 [Solirubrobacteraceae bacterium]|nr:hypothetical protein [Solirubrobacteraceae bacterium]
MFRTAWVVSAVATAALLVLGVVAESQKGVCYDGDPIPSCPDARGLAEWGYLLGGLLWLSAAVLLSLTLTALWRRLAK